MLRNQSLRGFISIYSHEFTEFNVTLTGDIKLNNEFKLASDRGLSCFALAKQDPTVSKDCIFQFVSVDSEIAPLDSYC